MPQCPCASCGKTIVINAKSLPAGVATCQSCRRKARTKPCGQCEKPFYSYGSRLTTCDECRGAAKTCARCGIEFRKAQGHARFCSEACRLSDRPKNTARRAIGRVEPYSRREIFERDGWRCQLCGDRVESGTPWPDGMSATIDHVVPISLGGADAPDNVQLAHFACNMSKGAGVLRPEQLRLA